MCLISKHFFYSKLLFSDFMKHKNKAISPPVSLILALIKKK